MKRIFTLGTLVGLAALALASVQAGKLFDTTYNVKPDSTLGKARCSVCHATKMGGKKLNLYGTDLQNAMRAAGAKALTAELLRKLDHVDSDKDGVKNLDEIKADRAPGS